MDVNYTTTRDSVSPYDKIKFTLRDEFVARHDHDSWYGSWDSAFVSDGHNLRGEQTSDVIDAGQWQQF